MISEVENKEGNEMTSLEIKEKMEKLSFEDCETLFINLEVGHSMRDLVMDRMERIDIGRFEKWLDRE
jgi:hypothetical protein